VNESPDEEKQFGVVDECGWAAIKAASSAGGPQMRCLARFFGAGSSTRKFKTT
jgi:hypothetical protein